ncbi:9010_t:CDS:10 [Cetraspora pellucida]|uniref:9010_t:CDS:1 n=1 Tax=Cetraspora pellucida TaxID=1433469 RepID=A0A9N9GQZ6_9GLOM|nr:9010_t:CDS:10 [Cetraspora pellucida]
MASSSLVVPLVLWNRLPSSPVTTVVYKEGHVATGLKDGFIWIYRCIVDEQGALQVKINNHNYPTLKEHTRIEFAIVLQHKVLCIGHKSAITALTITEGPTDGCVGNNYVLISASEDGEVMKWCLLDGRCLVSMPKALDGMIRSIKPLATCAEIPKFLLCSGFSDEITILNCTSLEIIRVWTGHNDWAACTPFYDSDARQIRLLSSNFNGFLKIWAFDENKQSIIKEYDNVGILQAQGDKILELINNPYDIGVIMAVTNNFIIIFTIRRGKMYNMQSIRILKNGAFWTSGVFLAKNTILAYTQTGDAHLYSISCTPRKYPSENGHIMNSGFVPRRSSLPDLKRLNKEKLSLPGHSKPKLLESVYSGNNDFMSPAKITVFVTPSAEGKQTRCFLIAFRNQFEGTSFAWKLLSTTTQEYQMCDKHVQESTWGSETFLSDLWPLRDHQTPKVTVATMVNDDQIAFGYENGEIHILPISSALTMDFKDFSLNAVKILKGHFGKITCMYTPNITNFDHKYLVTGGEDCSVRIWSLENGKRLASFTYHSTPVTHLFEPPVETCTRNKGCIISVAKDNSLSIISLDEMSCLYNFGGYPYHICRIQWRITEGLLALYYGDESVHIWQMKTSELYQIVKGSIAREMINDKTWQSSTVSPHDFTAFTSNKVKTLSSVNLQNNGVFNFQIFMINVKQLITDIYHYHVSQIGSKVDAPVVNAEDFDEKPDKFSKIFSWSTNGASHQCITSSLPSASELQDQAIDASSVQVIVSALMTWGIDNSLDRICLEKLGLKKPSEHVSFGLRGYNGNLSIAAPSYDHHEAWKISQTMTATHLLSIVSLTRPFLLMKGLEKYTSDIITHYGSMLPEFIGTKFHNSSLAFLAKYFQDPTEDIRHSAKTLFSAALTSMPSIELQSIIDYWKQFCEWIVLQLPAVTSQDMYAKQYMVKSTILLGMIGADHPKFLSKTVSENTALSLILLLHDESKLSHRLAALELCAVVKTIFRFAIDSDANAATVKAMAQRAIFQIAAVNTPLCISTLTYDTNNSKKPAEKHGLLKLISLFIRRKPLVLYTSLSSLVEAVVKSLDPNIPKMRETVLQTTTNVLHDLVKTFPSISFHGGTQKLAVGTQEGASIIYDLRTATRWHILEGHTKAVSALTFSGDGKFIVSCSLEEGMVRVWNPSPGLLGMIAGSLAPANTGNNSKTESKRFKALSASTKPCKTFKFSLSEDVTPVPTRQILGI